MLDGRCAFEQLDVGDNPGFAAWLLKIGKRIETAATVDEDPRARRLFYLLSRERR